MGELLRGRAKEGGWRCLLGGRTSRGWEGAGQSVANEQDDDEPEDRIWKAGHEKDKYRSGRGYRNHVSEYLYKIWGTAVRNSCDKGSLALADLGAASDQGSYESSFILLSPRSI